MTQQRPALPCSIDVENVWGPQVQGCGSDFDLTLLFQETILFIVPLSIATLWAAWRVWQLLGQQVLIASPVLGAFKTGAWTLATLLQIALFFLQLTLRTSVTRATLGACCLGMIGFATLLLLSHYEHGRSVRGSTVLILYLGVTTPANALRTRTLWSMPSNNYPTAAIFTAFCVCQAVLLVLELLQKTVRPENPEPTPDEKANIVSRALIWWLLPLFSIGRKTGSLTSDALPEIDPVLVSEGKVKPKESAAKYPEDGGSDSGLERKTLFRHIIAARGGLLLSAVLPRLMYTGFTYTQPFLVQRATEYMAETPNGNTLNVGGGLIGAYVIVYVGIAVTQAVYRQSTARAITAIRCDLVIKVHNHTLKLNCSSSSRDSASTLMSADVEQFAAGSRNMHEVWASIIELGIALWLLEEQLGVVVAATGGMSFVFVALTLAILPAAAKRQNAWLKALETRISATTKSLHVMKGVKMTGVASVVREDLMALRTAEAGKLRKFRYVLLIVAWAMWIPVIMSPILGFTLYSLVFGPETGGVLSPAMVYRCLAIFSLMGGSIAVLLDSTIKVVMTVAALLRIQSFLRSDNTRLDSREVLEAQGMPLDEDEMPLVPPTPPASPLSPMRSPSRALIRLRRLSRSLIHAPAALRLSQASAGWNTDKPSIVRNATMDVSSPMVLAVVGANGSGKTTLLQMLLGETQTAAGSVALSSRRVGYCSQTPWLTHDTVKKNIVGSDVFEENWYKEVVHATALERDIQRLEMGDNTILADDGGSLSGGQKKRLALARAIYTRASIILLDDPFNGLDARTESFVLEAVLGRRGILRKQRTLVVWATSSTQQVRFADRVISLTDTGDIRKRDSLLMAANRINEENVDGDGTLVDPRRLSALEVVEGIVTAANAKKPSGPPKPPTAATSSAAYRYFIGFSGRRKFAVFVCLSAIFVFGMTFNQYWIVQWAESSAIDPTYRQSFYIGLYFAIGAIQLIAWTGAAFFFIVSICEKSADKCHATILDTVLRAPMSFFDSTAAGETINRFSQDMQLIDTALPLDVLGFVTQVMIVVGICAIIIYGAPLAGLAIPFVATAVFFVQRAYLPTSRQLRVLEIEAKGPLFSHFLETLSGLATIRALRWTAAYARKNLEVVKTAQKPFFLLYSAQNWLNLVLDLVTAGLAVVIMAVGVATRSSGNPTLGLALLGAANIGMSTKQLITHWTELEISMAAVERVRTFSESTESESIDPKSDPKLKSTSKALAISESKSWHGQGRIQFRNVSARYTASSPLVLHDVSFAVQPGQRVGICGRTGSGKSSLLSTLLRILPLHEGKIKVDGVDISQMEPNEVRSRFITLPQEPLLVSGTVRHNMQLHERDLRDKDIIAALDDFGLWETLSSKGGLDVALTEEFLSHGQRQLFCFARSTLQRGNIVILDEPSSQSDPETEEKMEEAIREKFNNHTILCIAHKLTTIMSFDTIVVMDAGSIAEFGSPHALLEDTHSLLSNLMRSQTKKHKIKPHERSWLLVDGN